MVRSRHSLTKFINYEKTHTAANKKMFRRLWDVNEEVYEVEFAQSEVEHGESIPLGLFTLQYAKLRMLELYYNFFTMDTN